MNIYFHAHRRLEKNKYVSVMPYANVLNATTPRARRESMWGLRLRVYDCRLESC